MVEAEALTREEGLLLAIYLGDGEILGKVRLNKLLARLQRDGFPIINHFVNREKGPHDWDIDLDSVRLNESGFISLNHVQNPGYENLRVDYRLTDIGNLRVKQELLPKLVRNPFYRDFTKSFTSVKYEYKDMRIEDLAEKVHIELYISEDTSRFLTEVDDTKKALIEQFNKIESSRMDYCYSNLVMLGSMDFAIRCLNIIQEGDINDKATGKNNILVKSKELLNSVMLFHKNFGPSLEDCLHANQCLRGMNCLITELKAIQYALHCIEWNAGNYQILKPFGDDFDLADYITDEEESQFTSRLQTMNMMA